MTYLARFISFVLHEFQVLGLDTDTQAYTINTRTEVRCYLERRCESF